MLGQVLNWLVVFVPVALGLIVILVPSKHEDPRRHRRWRRILGISLIVYGGVVWWQGAHNMNEQAAIRAEGDRRTAAIQTQYDTLNGQLKVIGQFVEHPPAGLTKDQVADVVRTQIAAAAGKSQSPASGPPQTISPIPAGSPTDLPQNPPGLKAQALQLAHGMHDWIASARQIVPDIPDTPENNGKRMFYLQGLNQQFNEKFPDAEQMVGLLKISGLLVSCQKNTGFPDPKQVLQLRENCADSIQQAALKLP